MLVLFLSGCHFKSIKNQAKDPNEQVEIKDSSSIESGTIVAESIDAKTDTTTAEPVDPTTANSDPKTAPAEAVVKPVEEELVPAVPAETYTEPTQPTESLDTAEKPIEPVSDFSLIGQITLDQSKLENQNAELKNTIVYFEPAYQLSSILPKTNAVISTRNKEFQPNVLAITAGSTINFPNMDRILHNVFSVSPMSEFDLGLYSAGSSKDVVFNHPGVIYVHCNVHHSMQADILVMDTPYFTQVKSDGSFELKNIPEVSGTLNIWHPRGNIQRLQLNKNSNHKNINQSVVITRPEVPKHSNKFGKAYRRTRY